jgi:catechol 2,3-dioxygenase-like lactoylglutathione lyase family enzyme
MAAISSVGRVMIPVSDQDQAISFYTEKLGFELTADTPFGEGERWVEVTPPGGGAALALVPPRGDYETGRMTGVALDTSDAAGVQAELKDQGVDVDVETMGGDGTVPLLFFLRDPDGNSLMVVQMGG